MAKSGIFNVTQFQMISDHNDHIKSFWGILHCLKWKYFWSTSLDKIYILLKSYIATDDAYFSRIFDSFDKCRLLDSV